MLEVILACQCFFLLTKKMNFKDLKKIVLQHLDIGTTFIIEIIKTMS